MKKFTANYSHSNYNFVIQNLPDRNVVDEFESCVCIVRNLLQRGCPTAMSKYLQTHLGKLHKSDSFRKSYPLISRGGTDWFRTIRGDTEGNRNPAARFYKDLFTKHLPDFAFVHPLILPEAPLNEITNENVNEFAEQRADFYILQAYLIIEIDGPQHRQTRKQDESRDKYTHSYGVETVRITTDEVSREDEPFTRKMQRIRKRLNDAISEQADRKQRDPTLITLADYRSAYHDSIDWKDPNYQATAIIRFQLLLLELINCGDLEMRKPWDVEVFAGGLKISPNLRQKICSHGWTRSCSSRTYGGQDLLLESVRSPPRPISAMRRA